MVFCIKMLHMPQVIPDVFRVIMLFMEYNILYKVMIFVLLLILLTSIGVRNPLVQGMQKQWRIQEGGKRGISPQSP